MKNPMDKLLDDMDDTIQQHYECEHYVNVKTEAHAKKLKADINKMPKADMKRWLHNFIDAHNKYRKMNLDMHVGYEND